ncbi:polysaccharide deacetylase family protein [Actinomadura rayongensis]|uniref:Polysaccharide deacetylase family protein n=1 Tax=Actinomadura rayongensis TaxID=1429076 RepID=A0A6I4W2P9_9ACTN|nr:polysaccharide deacetylase family protein [Actinomadura rayongensis]
MRTRASAAAALLTVTVAAGCGGAGGRQAATHGHALAGAPRARSAPQAPPPPRAIDCARTACVALTFDDGPGPYTETLLNDLQAAGARATFFMLGENVASFPHAVRRAALAGHEIGNHSWSHPQLTGLPSASVRAQVQRTQRAIEQASGGVTPKLMRPPYGAVDKRVSGDIAMPEVLWSVDTLDWKIRDTRRVERAALGQAHRGSIVLMHDIHKTTVAAVPTVLAGLKKKGLTPVTVSELFSTDKPMQAGVAYGERVPPVPTPSAPERAAEPRR